MHNYFSDYLHEFLFANCPCTRTNDSRLQLNEIEREHRIDPSISLAIYNARLAYISSPLIFYRRHSGFQRGKQPSGMERALSWSGDRGQTTRVRGAQVRRTAKGCPKWKGWHLKGAISRPSFEYHRPRVAHLAKRWYDTPPLLHLTIDPPTSTIIFCVLPLSSTVAILKKLQRSISIEFLHDLWSFSSYK